MRAGALSGTRRVLQASRQKRHLALLKESLPGDRLLEAWTD
jgi:hypothetical protein